MADYSETGPGVNGNRTQTEDKVGPNGPDPDAHVPHPALDEWDVGEDIAPIPPREWLLDNLMCRQFGSGLFGDGATGKTAFLILCALSLATGRDLIGLKVFQHCKVLFLCFEDGKDELRRRIRAAMLHYKIAHRGSRKPVLRCRQRSAFEACDHGRLELDQRGEPCADFAQSHHDHRTERLVCRSIRQDPRCARERQYPGR